MCIGLLLIILVCVLAAVWVLYAVKHAVYTGGDAESQLAEYNRRNGGSYVTAAGYIVGTPARNIEERYTGDASPGVPFNGNTLFCIGSNAKSVMATAVGVLQEHLLAWYKDPITKYFTAPLYSNVTVADVLAHRSGIKEFEYGSEKWSKLTAELHGDNVENRKAFAERLLSVPPDYPPTLETHYASTPYVIIAAIIERVTGMDYRKFILDNVCRKLDIDIRFGHFQDDNLAVGNVVTGYGRTAPAPNDDAHWHWTPYTEPSGDMWMTLPHLAEFLRDNSRGLIDGKSRVLSVATYRQLHTLLGKKALGWNVLGDMSYHTGGASGFSSMTMINRRTGAFCTAFTNVLWNSDFGVFSYAEKRLRALQVDSITPQIYPPATQNLAPGL